MYLVTSTGLSKRLDGVLEVLPELRLVAGRAASRAAEQKLGRTITG
jgi:hypothetical protein